MQIPLSLNDREGLFGEVACSIPEKMPPKVGLGHFLPQLQEISASFRGNYWKLCEDCYNFGSRKIFDRR
jgi:hypothetical protein